MLKSTGLISTFGSICFLKLC